MEPLVSVIIPVYNTAGYLRQCLETITNQSLRNIEIICVDDGSTDNSVEILEEFASKDNRIIVLTREYASGSAAVPRNIGISMARGRYVMFLDSDDYFEEIMLEKMVAQAEKYNADLVICDNYVISADGSINNKNTEIQEKYFPNQSVFSYQTCPEIIFQIARTSVWNKLILHETVKKYNLRFQTDVPILDDVYFVDLLLVLSKRISVIKDRLVFYRMNRNDGQTTKIERHIDSIYLSFKALNDYLIKHSLYDFVKISLQNWTLSTMAWWIHSIGNYDKFCELYDLYKNDYFEKLGLLDIDASTLYDGLDRFYYSILDREVEPSLKVVLQSILKPSSDIIIYGAGRVGQSTYEVIKTQGKHTIKLWCDQRAEEINNPLVSHPKEILSCDFDALFIAIADYDVVEEVREHLIEIGIDRTKIYIA